MRSAAAELSKPCAADCTTTPRSMPRCLCSANRVSFGASPSGVYVRCGAKGKRFCGPNTWKCVSQAPGGSFSRGLLGLGWNDIARGIVGAKTKEKPRTGGEAFGAGPRRGYAERRTLVPNGRACSGDSLSLLITLWESCGFLRLPGPASLSARSLGSACAPAQQLLQARPQAAT